MKMGCDEREEVKRMIRKGEREEAKKRRGGENVRGKIKKVDR